MSVIGREYEEFTAYVMNHHLVKYEEFTAYDTIAEAVAAALATRAAPEEVQRSVAEEPR